MLLFAQQKELAEKLVGEGVVLHDAGDYVGAMMKYDEALRLDENNIYALAEKAMTLMVIRKPEEAVRICDIAINEHTGSDLLYMIYVIYGNACDELGESSRAIDIYNKGIEQFPDFYQLHFNKGITLLGMDLPEEAIISFQESAFLNPNHPGTHNAIGQTLYAENKLIPSLLAFAWFFVLEPEGNRAKENIEYVRDILKRERVYAEDKEEIGAVQFIRKFEEICSAVSIQKESNNDFYLRYYAPFFIEMKERGMVETFGYIVFVSSGSGDILKWIGSNEEQIAAFYEWVNSYKWG